MKKSDTWRIQLAIAINFIFFKDTDEERVMHSNSDNIEIMIYNKGDKVIQELHESFLFRYQTDLEELIEDSDFVFDCVNLLRYKCLKINVKRGGSYVDSPDWIQNKKLKIILINNGDKCFQFAATVALIHEQTGKNLWRVKNINPFTNKYNLVIINFLSGKDDWKK